MFNSDKYKRHTITAALPYTNGPVHIGHLAGVYLPADIYVRYLRLKEKDVLFICGSDEHGVPITITAMKEGKTPQQIVDHYHNLIKDTFKRFHISFDIYSRTTAPIHHQTASDFFLEIYNKGGFVVQTSQQYYDEEHQMFIADRYITGKCPHCQNERAYGDQCESCGTSLNALELINPISVLSGKKPILKETQHWYLPLDKYQEKVSKWILEDHKEWKSNVYGQCKSWLDQGLAPRAMTRDLDWGVKVPLEEAKGKVLYVWFDAPIGYISATKEWAMNRKNADTSNTSFSLTDWEPYWKDETTRLIHFIGKDNIVFHCIIFPVILMANGGYILPNNVPANEFLNLEGKKISTSGNWAVWLHEYLDEFPGKEDVLRYVLCANAPETKDNDFTWKDFQAKNNNELVAILGNFINRVMTLTHRFCDGKVPMISNQILSNHTITNEIYLTSEKISKAIENFKFREALNQFIDLARTGNKYLAITEPWKKFKTEPETVHIILYNCLQISAGMTLLMEPFLPFTSMKLRTMLNLESFLWKDLSKVELIAQGHRLATPELLFEKIEDEIIDKQIKKLE